MVIFTTLERTSRPSPSINRNRNYRGALLAAGLCQGGQEIEEREEALGREVAVIDPEPVATIVNRDEGVAWF